MQKLKLTLLAMGLATASIGCSADNQAPQGGQPPSTDEAFAQMDSNQDNLLSQSEVQGPLKNEFSTIDTNGDGYISKEELNNAPKPQGKPPQQQ